MRRAQRLCVALLGLAVLGAIAPRVAHAQWSTTYEQFYLPGSFNWTFRREYPAADRLFAAFDYGHAILYERLYNDPHAPVSVLEEREYDFITKKLLVSPPRLPLVEAAIEVNYAKLAPEAKMMFDWAHLLHRQIYDVLGSERMSPADKDAKIAELVTYYKTRPDLAFSSVPKNMELMEGQPYSLAFRQRYPKFNGLIWGYHWLQVGLYEPMMTGRTQEERQAGVAAAVTRFRQMLENAPEHMPRVMPMTAAIAPKFSARYQEAAIIFDNLHAMHDVVSDILTNDLVPRDRKRAAILEAASRYRDATSFVMPLGEWATMGGMMGIENMGGPSVGILPGWQTPTLARGASMLDAMKGMAGMPGMAGMSHAGSQATPSTASPGMSMPGMNHAGMAGMPGMPGMPATAAPGNQSSAHDSALAALHARMMRDPVIRERVLADTAMRRMMDGMPMSHDGMQGMPAAHEMKGMPAMHHTTGMGGTTAGRPKSSAVRRTPVGRARKAAPKRATKRRPMPAMDMKNMKDMKGMPGMPGMKP